jgi:tRNA(Leu) C34 or U34 (ribose-2'-O)-methylase TrmL
MSYFFAKMELDAGVDYAEECMLTEADSLEEAINIIKRETVAGEETSGGNIYRLVTIEQIPEEDYEVLKKYLYEV